MRLLGFRSARPARQPRGAGLRGLFGVALLLVAAGALMVVATAPTRPALGVVGGNLPVNSGAADLADISAHNSPTLARSPVEPAHLAVANRIDTPRFSCALHSSDDGGASWEQVAVPIPPSEEPKCYAGDVAFAADGTLHYLFVTLAGLGNRPNAVWLASAEEVGAPLSEPVRLLGELAFQVRLLADPQVPARLYLTWLQAETTATLAFPGTGYPIRAARSDDGGQTWSQPVDVSPPGRERVVAPSPAIGPGGAVYVAYLDLLEDRLDYHGGHGGRGGPPDQGPWQLVVARSGDGGQTWTETVAEDDLVPAERFIVFLPPAPSLAVDGQRVYAAFHDARLGDADVWLWASHDGAGTWGEPARVNDDPAGDGSVQRLAKVAVAPDGRVDVVYYDQRDGGAETAVRFQSSSDAGATFTPSLTLTDRPFDGRIGFGSERGLPDLGSRLGLLSTETAALAVWTDTRAGTEASNKQDLVRALVTVTPPPLPAAAVPALRAGAAAAAVAGVVLIGSALLTRRAVATSPA